jgi:large subunit ribosomal protein L35
LTNARRTFTNPPPASHWSPIASTEAALESEKEPSVPKMKTNRAAAKRFRVTGSGRVRRSKGGGNHGMQEKSRKRLRRLRNNDMVSGAFQKRIKIMLPYG